MSRFRDEVWDFLRISHDFTRKGVRLSLITDSRYFAEFAANVFDLR